MSHFWEEWWGKTYTRKKERIVLHVVFWVMYLSFLCYTAYEHFEISNTIHDTVKLIAWLCPLYLIVVYYFGVYIAYKSFQEKQLVKAFIAITIGFLLFLHFDIIYSYFLLLRLKAEHIPTKDGPVSNFRSYYTSGISNGMAIMHSAFSFVLYLFIPVICKFFRDAQRSSRQFRELKERNMQLELNLIKSQVNPHFLLNTLNNIYGFTLNGTRPQIGQMILSLSDFLKYSLYECNNEYVSVKKEVKLIENFIELEAIRSEFINTEFDVTIDEYSCSIPPFILFPLVENAFKHGTYGILKPTTIVITLSIVNNRLDFIVQNDLPVNKPEKGGIGLAALKKKIEYYYPNKYLLTSKVDNGRYIAELQIEDLCRK